MIYIVRLVGIGKRGHLRFKLGDGRNYVIHLPREMGALSSKNIRPTTTIGRRRIEEIFVKFAKATLGSIISIKNANEFESYLLVGDNEEDPFTHKVSVRSSMGKSLLNKQKYDLVHFQVPGESQTYVVTNVFSNRLLKNRLLHHSATLTSG
jgi:hypothetical protein